MPKNLPIQSMITYLQWVGLNTHLFELGPTNTIQGENMTNYITKYGFLS